MKGRSRDSFGKPLGESSYEKAYAVLSKDLDAENRLKYFLTHEIMNGERSLELGCTDSLPLPLHSHRLPIRKRSHHLPTRRCSHPPLPTNRHHSLSSAPIGNRSRSSDAQSTNVVELTKQSKKECKHDGCTKPAHRSFWPFCLEHKVVVLCSNCNKNQSKYSGGLCKKCFNNSLSPKQIKEQRLCVKCNLRLSRQIGGRCKVCISDAGGKRVKK